MTTDMKNAGQQAHWYVVCLEGRPAGFAPPARQRCSTVVNVPSPCVTNGDLERAKRACGLVTGPETLVISVSYLGQMTAEVFYGANHNETAASPTLSGSTSLDGLRPF